MCLQPLGPEVGWEKQLCRLMFKVIKTNPSLLTCLSKNQRRVLGFRNAETYLMCEIVSH